MINLLELFTNLFNSALMVYTFYLFFAYFAEKRLNKWLHFLLLSLIGLALTCILSFVPMGMLRTVLICLIPLLVSILFKLKWYSHFLLSVLIYATGGILEFVTTILLSLLFSVDTQTATEGAFRILGIVLSKMLMLLVLAIMKIFKYKFSYSLTVKKTLTLLIIPVSTTVISLLHINLFVKFPAQSQTLVYSSLASYIVLILSNIVVFHLIDNSYRESEKEKQVTILTELLNAQTKQYEQMQEHNQEVMKIRHDQKNFLIGIISELESGNVDATKKLLKEQLDTLKRPDKFDFNDIVSTVVKTKADYAGQHGIEIDFQYSGLHKIQIPPVDIAIILGNALDNAIEAVQRITDGDRTIHAIVKTNNNLLVIVIKNPTPKAVDVTNLISTKRNNGTRGFGIASIEELTKKHGGEVIFKCEDLTFETNIIMRNINE